MTPADITALRAKACDLMAALGQCLDSLTLIGQTLERPDDAFSDGVVISQHLDEAAELSENFASNADEFAKALDRHAVDTKARITALERGTPFDEALPAVSGGAS